MRLLFAFLTLTSSLGAASLTWDKSSVELTAKADEKIVTVSFRYTNKHALPVRITSVVAGCDCTTPEVSKGQIAPGASGELLARVSLAGVSGRKETMLTVVTDDDAAHSQFLRIAIAVPEAIAFSPRLLFWSPAEPLAPKFVAITVADPTRGRIENVQTESRDFRVALERGDDPRALRVRIEPVTGRGATDATIRINARIDDQAKQFVLYAAVR